MQADGVIAAKIDSGLSSAVQADAGFEAAFSILNLDGVLHRATAAGRLDIQTDDVCRLWAGIIALHLDIHTKGDRAMMAEDLGMQPGRPAGSMFVQPRAMPAGIAFLMMRIEAGIQRPRVGSFAAFLMNQREHFMRAGLHVVVVTPFEQDHRVQRLGLEVSLTHSRGERRAATNFSNSLG